MPGARIAPSFSFTVTSVPSGNTVSRCADTTSFGRPPPLPLRSAITLPSLIDRGVLEAELLKPLQIIFGADFFLEGRRRDFGDALLFFERTRVIGLDVFQRLDDFWVGENGAERRPRPSSRRRALAQLPCHGRQQSHDRGDGWSERHFHGRSPHQANFLQSARPISFSRAATASRQRLVDHAADIDVRRRDLFLASVRKTPIR